ncbi:protein kinase, putative [Bodo saltans]|uniref:Protein kinase, putative n=1 Tax=Bodo saltans TaxID=75058 RepID=A0A0S4J6J2_BODSA|nr:protein kinase, putative [Bodo saltans]|eukprot:CUG84919.1 protein kinase, putative [Bodo saltans]
MLDAVRVSQIQSITFAPGDLRQHATVTGGTTNDQTPSITATTNSSHAHYDDLDGPLPLALRDEGPGIRRGSGQTTAASLTPSLDNASHPNFFPDETNTIGPPLETTATGAFSPLALQRGSPQQEHHPTTQISELLVPLAIAAERQPRRASSLRPRHPAVVEVLANRTCSWGTPGIRRGSGQTTAASLTPSLDNASHPNFFPDETNTIGPPLETTATGAFSPLSASERFAATGAPPDDPDLGAASATRNSSRTTTTTGVIAPSAPPGGRRGSGQSHVFVGDLPSSTLDASLGPATAPVYSAFCSDELIISKFAVLLSSIVQLARASSSSSAAGSSTRPQSSNNGNFSAQFLRSTFLPASRGSVFACVSTMDLFRKWVEANDAAASGGGGRPVILGNGSRTIVVHVTPRGGMVGGANGTNSNNNNVAGLSVEDNSLASSSSGLMNNNSRSSSKANSLDAQVQAFLAATPLPMFVEALVRECTMEFPRLVHIVVDSSPFRRAQQDITNFILGSKRRSSVGGANNLNRTSPMPSSLNPNLSGTTGAAVVPPLALWQPAAQQQQQQQRLLTSGEERTNRHLNHQNELSVFLSAEPPRFVAVRTIAEAFLNLFEKETVGLLCQHSSEYNARYRIALDHVLERWNTAMDFLSKPPPGSSTMGDAKNGSNNNHNAVNKPSSSNGVVAKASRTVGGPPPPLVMPPPPSSSSAAAGATSSSSSMSTVADELVQLSLDFSRIASSSTSSTDGPHHHPTHTTIHNNGRRLSTQSLGSQELVYSFEITMSKDFDGSYSGSYGDSMWNFSTDGTSSSNNAGGGARTANTGGGAGSDSSVRYHQPSSTIPSAPAAYGPGATEMIQVTIFPPPSPLRRRTPVQRDPSSPPLLNSSKSSSSASSPSERLEHDERVSSRISVESISALILATTALFMLGSVIGLSASGEAASSSVAAGLIVVSVALMMATCVSVWVMFSTHQRRARLSIIEQDLNAALAVVASAMTQPTNAPSEIATAAPSTMTSALHHYQPHHGATPASAMSTMGTATLAISTPSPFPQNNNSGTSMLLLDARQQQQQSTSAFVVLGGNQTPLGFFDSKPTTSSAPPLAIDGMGGRAGSLNVLAGSNAGNNGGVGGGKKPNPLTTEAIMAPGAFGDDGTSGAGDEDDEEDVVRVRMDPTGTFLIPFMEKEPILLDGVYVHQHLAVLGIEFTRLLNEDPTGGSMFGGARSASGMRRGESNGDSMMVGDDCQDEDRYSICMWNLAMSEASGGYTAAQVVDQTLAQVVADNDSYHELVQRIVKCEEQFDAAGSSEHDPISTDSFILKVVHKEHGSRSLRMSLSPVIRWEGTGGDNGASSFSFGGPRLVCIGVLLVGVPVDAQGQVQAFNFRNLFLSEVAEECIQASTLISSQLSALIPTGGGSSAQMRHHSVIWGTAPIVNGGGNDGGAGKVGPQRSPLASSFNAIASRSLPPPLIVDNNRSSFISAVMGTVSPTNGLRRESTAILATVASPSTTSLTDPSPRHNTIAFISKLRDFKRINDYFLWKAMQDLSSVGSFEEQPWKSVYTNFIPGMLAKSFPRYNLRVKVESTVPSIVEANILGLTAVVDHILNTVPPKTTPTQGHLMATSLRSASLGATQTPLAGAAGGSTHASAAVTTEASNIRVTFGVLQDSSVSMFCKIEHLQVDRFIDLLVREIELEEQTNTAPPSGSFLYLMRAVQGKLMAIGGGLQHDDLLATKGVSTPGKEVPEVPNGFLTAAKQSSGNDLADTSLRSADETPVNPPILAPRLGHPSPSFSLGKDTLVILFPFRMHNGANGAVSAWETRAANKGNASITSYPTSIEGSQRDTLMNISSPSLAVAAGGGGGGGDPFILTVMIDVHNELDRQKYIRRFWEDHHSVFPIDPNKFMSRGVKLLRSQCRNFDAVVLDIPLNVNDVEFEKKMEDIAREFPDTVFVLLRSKAKKKRHSIVQQQRAAAAPPLAPKPNSAFEKQSSGLFSFVPTPQPKPDNLHVIPKAHTQQGINELLTYVVSRVTLSRDSIKRKQHIKDLFKQHRTSAWTKGKKLGRGTFGDVYEANFSLTGGRMAVKIIRLPSNDPHRLEQLINEVEILVKVQHPNIVQYFYCEAGAISGEVNIFMELCTGGSLEAKCRTLKSLDIAVISTWTQQLCSSLAYLHLNHLAHRDIKPANVLLSETGVVKLADFGTATAVSLPLNEVAGTFAYMAPEVYAGADYGTPCDVWSVGCVILDLLGKETLQNLVGSTSGGLGGGYFHECDSDDVIWKRLELHVTDALLLDFLRGCFRLDPLQRNTAEQLLLHPFLTRQQAQQNNSQASPILQKKRSAPNLTRKSHESSVGALSVDSGEFNRRSASASAIGASGDDGVEDNDNDDDDDDSSDDGWGDLVRGGEEDSDSDFQLMPKATSASPTVGARQQLKAAGLPAQLTVASTSASSPGSSNCFTPKFHNGPSPVSRSKLVAESPAAQSRRKKQNGGLLSEEASGGVSFSTGAAALARRQSTLQPSSATSSSGGLMSPPVVPDAK